MTITYKILRGGIGNQEYGATKLNEDGSSVSFLFVDGSKDFEDYKIWLSEGNEAIVEEEPLSVLIAKAKESVDQFAKNARIKIAGTSDSIEIAAWSNKLRIAKAIIDGSATQEDIQSIKTEAALRDRGESIEELCHKIVSYSAQYAIAVATVDGIQKKAHGVLESCKDQDSINQVLDSLHKIANEQLARLA